MNKYLPFRFIFLLGTLAFGVTLAVMIGQRLSSEAMAILMGVVAGVVASIPTSIIVVWIAMQAIVKPASQARPQPAPREEPVSQTTELPRLVLVQQPMPQQAMAYPQPGWTASSYHPMMPTPAPRKFTVIGGTAESEDLTHLQPLEMDM